MENELLNQGLLRKRVTAHDIDVIAPTRTDRNTNTVPMPASNSVSP